MSKWILNISLSAVSANSRAMWIIGLVPLFLLSSYPCIEIEGTIEKFTYSFIQQILNSCVINIHAGHYSSRCGQGSKQDGVVFCLQLFPFQGCFKSVGEKWMTHIRSLLPSTRLAVSLVSVSSCYSGIQQKHLEADLAWMHNVTCQSPLVMNTKWMVLFNIYFLPLIHPTFSFSYHLLFCRVLE